VDFDIYASLLDFPYIFKTTVDTIPDSVPYLFAEPEKIEYWRKKITAPDFKVGIVWAGSPTHGHDRYRSCPLKYFAPLSQIDGVQLYGLQKGDAAGQMDQQAETIQIVNISKDFADFTDTAAAIENMDLVISVDTSVLHLAAAMGKQVWALLAYSPEWRWMLDRKNSPWYPTMRLFRQKKLKDWQGLFKQVTEELQILVNAKNKGQK
jgi:ADP-heptose:LPS heptosyltransferase